MPTYDYACENCGHHWDVEQRMSDDPIRKCPKCGKLKAKRQITGGNFILKGGGWYADAYSSTSSKKDSSTSNKDGGDGGGSGGGGGGGGKKSESSSSDKGSSDSSGGGGGSKTAPKPAETKSESPAKKTESKGSTQAA